MTEEVNWVDFALNHVQKWPKKEEKKILAKINKFDKELIKLLKKINPADKSTWIDFDSKEFQALIKSSLSYKEDKEKRAQKRDVKIIKMNTPPVKQPSQGVIEYQDSLGSWGSEL